ncbi:hypothetical protein [Dactylosporangium sp. NPDC051484]|uniref:hypothetical protein n=1 Tax=Dactylosporangium sp. NPDC051484 TaxID=3154942 RepID=UPI00344E0BFB
MCQRVACSACGKATYAGCGDHVDEVLAGVPEAQRCTCERGRKRSTGLMSWLRGR